MRRLAHSLAAAFFVFGVGALAADASGEGATPTVSGVSAHLVSPNQDLVVTGTGFSSDLAPGDCTSPVAGAPTVHFKPLSGAAQVDARPAGTDATHCSNTAVHVAIPVALSGGARVSLTDTAGHTSNDNQVVTVGPVASVNPSAGQTGAATTIQGSGLRPGSLASPNGVSLTVGGQPRGFADGAWNDNRLPFDPRNAGGAVVLSFLVVNDLNRPSSDPGNVTRVDFNAGNYTFQAPSADQSAITHQTVGSRVHLSGHNLGSGGTVSFPGAGTQRGASWTSDGFDATVPLNAQPGQLSVGIDGYGSIAGPAIQLDPKVISLAPSSTSAGQPVRVTGYNLGSSPGTIRVGSTEQAVGSWADQVVTFNLSPDADGGVVTLTRADGAAIDAASLSVVPRLDKLEGNNLQPGAQVVVDGDSLGSGTGTASIGATEAVPLLWSLTSLLLHMPATLAPGTYPVTVVSAAGARSNPLSLTVVAAPTQAPGSPQKPGAPRPGDLLAPSFDNNHDFVKPIKPPSPVFFNISTDPHKIRAGESADVVVVLKLNDKPLSGAQVKLSMLFTPGSDYTFTPDSGVTDATGTFKARVKVSKTPGDSVIAATSGVFSDQDHVAGTGADGKTVQAATQANPAAQNPGFAPLAIVGAVAVALVAAGFYLNVRSISR